MWNADFVRHSIRTRARRRPRRCFSAYDFEDEDDDKDDDNTLHKANFNPRPDYGFFVLKGSFTRAPPLAASVQSDRKRNSEKENIECRIMNIECRSKVFCLFYKND